MAEKGLLELAAECLGKEVELTEGVAGSKFVKCKGKAVCQITKSGKLNVYGPIESRDEMGNLAHGAEQKPGWVVFPTIKSFISHDKACKWLTASYERPAPAIKKPASAKTAKKDTGGAKKAKTTKSKSKKRQ